MSDSASSIIILCAFVLPAAVFLAQLERFETTAVLHVFVMSFICLAIGMLFAGMMITLTHIESQTMMAASVVVGSALAATVRVIHIRKTRRS